MSKPKTTKAILDQLSAEWSAGFEAYASGRTGSPRCALCEESPCACPEFGTPEYMAQLDKRHRKAK